MNYADFLLLEGRYVSPLDHSNPELWNPADFLLAAQELDRLAVITITRFADPLSGGIFVPTRAQLIDQLHRWVFAADVAACILLAAELDPPTSAPAGAKYDALNALLHSTADLVHLISALAAGDWFPCSRDMADVFASMADPLHLAAARLKVIFRDERGALPTPSEKKSDGRQHQVSKTGLPLFG
jgi:hypothetical protein